MTDEELVKMARLAQRDDRMSTGALYGDLADRIEQLINLNEALVELLEAARADAKEAEAYAEELDAKLGLATWLLTEAAVQLVEGKIKTRRNRAAIIWNLLDEMKANDVP